MAFPLQVESERTAVALNDLLRDHNAGLLNTRPDPRTGRPQHKTRGAIGFVLLEDLESGGIAQAFVLRKTDRPVQIVTIKGTVSGGSFKLHYGTPIDPGGPEASGEITPDATAAQMVTALEQIESIGVGGVSVTLGKAKYLSAGVETEVITGRWFIEFLKLASPELLQPFEVLGEFSLGGLVDHLITTETHFLKLTDKQETVHSVTPVPDPTPQKAGAIGQAQWIHGIGFSVVAIECHDFTAADDLYYG